MDIIQLMQAIGELDRAFKEIVGANGFVTLTVWADRFTMTGHNVGNAALDIRLAGQAVAPLVVEFSERLKSERAKRSCIAETLGLAADTKGVA